MRFAGRSVHTPLLIALGALASAASYFIWLTGGFSTRLGPIRISMHGLDRPLAIAAAAWIALAVVRRHQLADDGARLLPFLRRHATAIALVVAAGCAGTGIRYNTFAAHATDPSGYVSHAARLVAGRLVRSEPLVRTFSTWHGGAWNFSPLGYRPGVAVDEIVPTYPLGLPAVMALLRLPFGETGGYFAVPLLAATFVLALYALARRLHSAEAGLVAAVLGATSPILLFHTVQPMSDVPAAAWLTLAVLGAVGSGWWSSLAAGLCLGMLGATRPNLAPFGLLVAACVLGWPRTSWPPVGFRRAVPAGIGLALTLGPLLVLQTRLYGSPIATGYGGLDQYFAWSNILPNVADYAERLWTGEAAALALAAGACVLLAARRPLPDAIRHGQPREVGDAVRLALAGTVVILALYLPYGIFPDWAYLRFLLPGMAFGFVCAGAVAAAALTRVPAWGRGPLLVVVLALVAWANVRTATAQQVFQLARYEGRYRSVGRYLQATLRPEDVVVTFQESGAISYYANARIVRWDFLPLNLEEALEALRGVGLRPLLVVEDWEKPRLRERFPGSALAALDWTPRADIGETTHVWILDPLDRGAAKPPVTDRFR